MSEQNTFPIRTIHYQHDGIRIIYEVDGRMKTKYLFFAGDPDNRNERIFFFFGKWRENIGDKITYIDEGDETITIEEKKYQMKEPVFLLGFIPWSQNKIVHLPMTTKVCLRRDLIPNRINPKRNNDAELAVVSVNALTTDKTLP